MTPLTSMVVVKPEEEDVEDVEDPDAPKDAAPTGKCFYCTHLQISLIFQILIDE